MSPVHDYIISNASGAAVRSDLNNALSAIVSNNSSATEPATTYAYQMWADTGSSPAVMKLRDSTNSSWITLYNLDGSSLPIASATEIVFNDAGADLDFRIEGDNQANLFFVDAGNDRIGIGTATFDSASESLRLENGGGTTHLSVIATDTSAGLSIVNLGDSDDYNIGRIDYDHSDNSLNFRTNNNTRATIDSSGNVGIGTSTLNTNTVLSVHKGDSSESQIRFTNSTTGEAGNNGFLVGIDASEGGRLFVQENNYLRFGTNNTEVGQFNSSGQFLVGTTSAVTSGSSLVQAVGENGAFYIAAKNDTTVTEANSIGGMRFYGNDDDGSYDECARIECAADGTHSSTSKPSRLRFHTTGSGATSPTERMRISSNGSLNLGTINNTSGSVDTNSRIFYHSIEANANSTLYIDSRKSDGFIVINQTYGDNANRSAVYIARNEVIKGSISVSSTQVYYNTTSDYRLKENVADVTGGIDLVKQLQPRSFNFIDEPGETIMGFVAHEVQNVVPNAVSGTKDGLKTWEEGEELPDGVSVGDNKLDENGDTIPDYQCLDQAKLVPVLTAALKEAIAKIETLEAKVAALESA